MTQEHDRDVESLIGRAGSRIAPSAERAARVRAAAEEAWRTEVRGRRLRRWYWAGGALAAAAMVWLVIGISMAPAIVETPVQPAAPLAALTAVQGRVLVTEASGGSTEAAVGFIARKDAILETSPATSAALQIDDGGELRLGADTRAALVDSRTIRLDRGTIYLDSQGATPGGFTVITAMGTVRDIGTRFEVRASGTDARIRVRQGTVQFERGGAIERVPAGVELSVIGGRVESRAIAPSDAEWRWVTHAGPTFVVEGATLDAFLKWAEREGGYTVDGAEVPARLRATVLHGSVAGMSVEDALLTVLPTCGLTPHIVGGRLSIRGAR